MPISTYEQYSANEMRVEDSQHGNIHAISKLNGKQQPYRTIYDSESDIEIVKCFSPGCITDLHDEMQNAHPFLYRRENRIPVLEKFAKTGAKNIGNIILEALGHDTQRNKIFHKLNTPTLSGFHVLDHMGLPDEGDVIFSSTATANSSHDDAITTALDILGFTDEKKGIKFHRSSTVANDGFTMFGHQHPKNSAVYFDPHAQLDNFADGVARPLAKQFFYLTLNHSQEGNSNKDLRVVPTYDKMYHYGCISQSKTTDAFGMPVTNWGIHEQWNILMGSAMMHHVALTLKPGGNALVKVRVVKRAETLGLIALLSSLFKEMKIVDVPDQSATYVGAIFFSMTDNAVKRQKVADTIWNAMDQNPVNIFCNEVMQGDKMVKNNLDICNEHRRSMMDYRSRVDTLFMDCVQHLADQIRHRRPADSFPMKHALKELYGSELGNYYYDRWVDVHIKLVKKMPKEADNFLWVMQRRWSAPWHG